MKRLCWFVSTVLLLSLWIGKAAISDDGSYDFATDLSSYEEGDIPKPYLGEALVVKSYTTDSGEIVKYITSQGGDATFLIKPIKASGEFEVILEVNGNDSFGLSISNDETNFKFSSSSFGSSIPYYCRAALGNNDTADCAKSSTEMHTIKLKVKDGVVKSYINSAFFQSYTLEQSDAVFTEILISEIGTDAKIYSIKGRNLNGGSSLQSNTTGGNTTSYDDGFNVGKQTCISNPASCGITISDNGNSASGDCMADYSLDGQLHVPCVSVPDVFGSTTVYDIKMNQQTEAFTFDLDMGSVKPR